MKYCSKETNKDKWRVQKQGTYYGLYSTKETAEKVALKLDEYGWDKKNIPRIKKELGIPESQQKWGRPKNYTYDKSRGYRVSKIIKGKRITFGDYEDEEIAKKVVDRLYEYGWNQDNLPRIRDELGLEDPTKNYRYNKKTEKWNVEYKHTSYGNYETEEEAKIIVREMRKRNWDRTQLKDVWWEKQILGTIICKPKYYYYRKDRDQYEVKFGKTFIGFYVTEKEAKEAVEKHKHKYVKKKKKR